MQIAWKHAVHRTRDADINYLTFMRSCIGRRDPQLRQQEKSSKEFFELKKNDPKKILIGGWLGFLGDEGCGKLQ
jgi:hypothetical protein